MQTQALRDIETEAAEALAVANFAFDGSTNTTKADNA